ncbi:MAG: type II secretion system protein F [Candidatus Contendobacter odensis]|uniref:Type II secretion system protein F n=1 Tax=Candidatus Contendibacter odensensis TaxID=1400860 RepID=A0A2G6PGG6_9GAMM|nr:MAG: type II secretion system protein F [Candidatus Contendobacter odensis]
MAKAKQKKKNEELTFKWEGTDKRGVRVKGELRGLSQNLVKAELRRQGIIPLRVRKKADALFSFGGAIEPKDIMLFSRQFCTMLESGIAVVQALDMIGHSNKKPKVKELILDIKNEVEGGTSLSKAMGKHHLYFDDLYCSLVHAGEEAGVLEVLLDKIAIYLEKSEALKKKIKKALTYPIIVLIFAFVVTAILLLFVIPTFEDLFKGFGAELPALTRFVLELSALFQEHWYIIFGVPIFIVVVFIQARKRSRAFYQFLDRMVLKLPLIGDLVATSANARFARTLSTLFGGGVPLVDAMQSVAGATGNYVYESAVLQMRESVSIGQQLNFAMRQSNLFPDMVIQMVAIGEEAGSLGDMLAKVADFYEEEVDAKVDTLTTMIEPLLMAFLAGVVGTLVIAMYLPIFKLASAV